MKILGRWDLSRCFGFHCLSGGLLVGVCLSSAKHSSMRQRDDSARPSIKLMFLSFGASFCHFRCETETKRRSSNRMDILRFLYSDGMVHKTALYPPETTSFFPLSFNSLINAITVQMVSTKGPRPSKSRQMGKLANCWRVRTRDPHLQTSRPY